MNNPAMTAPLSAGRRQQTIVGAVLTVQIVAVLALLPARQEEAPRVPAPETAAASPAAAPVAETPAAPKARERKREAADKRRIAAPPVAKATAISVAAAAQAAPVRAAPENIGQVRQTAETDTETRAEGTEVVEGTWVGVRSCADSPDLHIALKIVADKAWVYSHSGPAAAPLSPGCLSATWSYSAGRTYLQVLPQAWLWRTAQTNALRLAGFVSGKHIDGEIADVPGCRAFTLHKAAANAFPADCQ